MERKLLTVSEAAMTLGIGRSLLYTMVTRGEIPSVTIGRARRISAAAIDGYIKRLESEHTA